MTLYHIVKFGLVSLAILAVSFQPTQVNALTAERSEPHKPVHHAAPKKVEHHAAKKPKAAKKVHKPAKAVKHKQAPPKHVHKTPQHKKPNSANVATTQHGSTPPRSKSGLVWGGGPDQLPAYAKRKGMLYVSTCF